MTQRRRPAGRRWWRRREWLDRLAQLCQVALELLDPCLLIVEALHRPRRKQEGLAIEPGEDALVIGYPLLPGMQGIGRVPEPPFPVDGGDLGRGMTPQVSTARIS